ncbi:DNRLRE domain-containing protein [Cohnella hashimotonis]|uniref:DNRLRE domain-containing protein n=1 Tax=Cohnella hashimotonis TaxID=2826895 RepID=A0ABT6TTU2_9BACL|nr:DNRLRE domain-containing protein [Cohnella hashimotonis]MDI4649598.1 DNRLRE domain-containing protein [Cohnella hashimotonis]
MSKHYRTGSLILLTALGLSLLPVSSFAAIKTGGVHPAKPATIVKEVTDSRTTTSQTYLYSDGSYEAVLFAKPVQYRDASGKWQEIKPSLLTAGDAGYHSAGTPYQAELPADYAQGYQIGFGESSLALLPVDANAATGSIASNRRVVYASPWTNTEATLALTDNAVQETLTLQSADAPASFAFEVTGGLSADLTAGDLRLPEAWLRDAVGQTRPVAQSLRQANGHDYLDLKPDLAGLTYPVAIQHAVQIHDDAEEAAGQELSVAGAVYADRDADGAPLLKVGRAQENNIYAHLQFNLAALPANITVQDAYLSVLVTPAAQAAQAQVSVLRHDSAWSAADPTGADAPEALAALDGDGAPYGNAAVTGVKSLKLPIKALASEWVSGTQPNYGLALASDSNDLLTLASSQAADLSARPQLHIRYDTPESLLKKNSLFNLNTLQLFQYVYDAQNRLQDIVLPNGDRIHFTYDAHGNLTKRELIVNSSALTEETEPAE